MELQVEKDKWDRGQQAQHLHLCQKISGIWSEVWDKSSNLTNCLLDVANRSKPGQDIFGQVFVVAVYSHILYSFIGICCRVYLKLFSLGLVEYSEQSMPGKLTYDNWGSLSLGYSYNRPLRGAFFLYLRGSCQGNFCS